MIKRYLALGFILLIVLFTGCIESTTTIAVRKDGSGLIMETTYVSKNIEKLMRNMVKDMKGSETSVSETSFEDKPIDMVKYRAKAQKMGEGVTLISAKRVRKDDGSPGERIVYAFQDVRKLMVQADPENPASEDAVHMMSSMKKSNKKSNPIRFDFLPGHTPRLYIFLPEKGEKSSITKKTQETSPATAKGSVDEGIIEFFRDFRVRVNVKVMDSEIVSTNATYVHAGLDPSKKQYVTLFDMNFNEIIDNKEYYEKLSQMDDMDVMAAAEKFKNIPGFKIEPLKKIEIVYR